MKEEWKEGEPVVVVGRGLYDAGLKKRTVERVLKRFIELNDGTKWDHQGNHYPRGGGWFPPHIRRPREGDVLLFAQQRVKRDAAALGGVHATKVEALTLEQLNECSDLLKRALTLLGS